MIFVAAALVSAWLITVAELPAQASRAACRSWTARLFC
jgi:hypothetical protein